ncbi:hypothetical protein RS030_101583 [Cryptosporidium xiaoi]|uniref:Uncharacterized protein n=1 Tax=Cryptosporidium xiaoi TaxID=659607 RepID=A0AAV9Y2M7_9CRYT
MTYIRGIWLFGNSLRGSLELILSRRYKTVENRVKELLGESNYICIPDDNKILDWFLNNILYENVSRFPSKNVPLIFKSNTLGGVFSVDNIQTNDCGEIDVNKLQKISYKQLLNYMHISNEKGRNFCIWPFIYSFRNGFFLLALLSLEESISMNPKVLSIYRSFCGDFSNYVNRENNEFDVFETIKLVEIRITLQLLEDLLTIICSNQHNDLIDINNIQKIWRIMIPFGSPILDNKEAENILEVSSNNGIPKYLIRLLEENHIKSKQKIPKYKFSNEQGSGEGITNIIEDQIEDKSKYLFGDFYLDSVNETSEEVDINSEIEFNDDFSASVPISANKNLFIDVFSYGIGKLSINKKGLDYTNNSNLDYTLKFSLTEIISCFAKKHPLCTEIKYENSLVDNYTAEKFMEQISKPYSSFISGTINCSGKLPSSVSISCDVLLPWQKVFIEEETDLLVNYSELNTHINSTYINDNLDVDSINNNNNNKHKYKYIQPYILAKDNVSCTKISDEYFDLEKQVYKKLNSGISQGYNNGKLEMPFSRYKLSWKNNQINSSEIFSYWYPYEKKIPIKGYFTILPETKEPINQIAGSRSKGNFRPILIHDFQMEYCLCLDPKIVIGLEQCQITIPLIPGTLKYGRNRDIIPSMIIFNHTLRTSMGSVTISPDKKSIYWVINNPKELISKKTTNNSSKINNSSDLNRSIHLSTNAQKQNSLIQIRMNGSIRIRLIYKEKNKFKNRNKNSRIMMNENLFDKNNGNNIIFDKSLISPILESYPIDISVESGIPHYYKNKVDDNNELLYSAPNPFAMGIQSLLNHPIKDIDPMWLLELHPKIARYTDMNNTMSKKEIYKQLMDLIFSYSLVSFVANLSSNYDESTYRGIHIPKNTIKINPKALRFIGPEIYSNSGKYIIWRNS